MTTDTDGKTIRKAFLMLLFVAAPLAEILSGNVPVLKFIHPPAFVFLTLVYGLPVLLIRELAVAKNLNILGIILLGLGYGLLNEGVIAKTLTQLSGQPVGPFAGYGQLGAFEGGWALFIVFWHALHSVLYPVLVTHWTFPAAAKQRWFSKRGLVVALVPFAALYALHFVMKNRPPVPAAFAGYILAQGLFAFLAVRFCRRKAEPAAADKKPSLKPVLLGTATVFFYIGNYALAAKRPFPFPVFALLVFGLIAFAVWRIARAGWRPMPEILLFGLGDDLAFGALAGIGAVATHNLPVQHGIDAVIFVIIFTGLIRAVRRAPAGRGTATAPPQGETA